MKIEAFRCEDRASNSELAIADEVAVELVDGLLRILTALERHPPEADGVIEAQGREVAPSKWPELPEEPTQLAFAADDAHRNIGHAYNTP